MCDIHAVVAGEGGGRYYRFFVLPTVSALMEDYMELGDSLMLFVCIIFV
jgi:hypothetical protein